MSTKLQKTKSNSLEKSAEARRSHRKRASKCDRLIQLLNARLGVDIATLSRKLDWQHHSTRAALSRLRKAGYTIEKRTALKRGGARYRMAVAPKGSAR
jgi:predicted transcriptional regulator